jgi:hypothetical protein
MSLKNFEFFYIKLCIKQFIKNLIITLVYPITEGHTDT